MLFVCDGPDLAHVPLIIDGRRFYDVIGNVWEWGWDEWSDKLPGGKNPVHAPGSSSGVSRIIRGGSWLVSTQRLRSALRSLDLPSWGRFWTPFRAVLRSTLT